VAAAVAAARVVLLLDGCAPDPGSSRIKLHPTSDRWPLPAPSHGILHRLLGADFAMARRSGGVASFGFGRRPLPMQWGLGQPISCPTHADAPWCEVVLPLLTLHAGKGSEYETNVGRFYSTFMVRGQTGGVRCGDT
jgi:hypothetical protein